MAFLFTNGARAVLVQRLEASATIAYIDEALADRFAAPSGANVQRCMLTDDTDDFELVDITSNPLTGALTITRAVESSASKDWASGSRIEQVFSAAVLTSVALGTALAALSAVTPAADRGIYFDSASTAALFTLTAYGRSMAGVADEAAFKALVNLEANVDYQPYSATLAAYVATPLATAELTQLQNINTTVISATQWGYLGAATAFAGPLLAAANVAAFNTAISLGTGNTPQFAGLELGHASDTTITRTGAGVIAVEGVEITQNTRAQTLTNKTLTSPDINGGTADDLTSLSGRPAIGAHSSGTLDTTDGNRVIIATANVEIPSGVYTSPDVLLIVNTTSSGITLTQGAGGTQRLAGSATTGNLTLAGYGVASVVFRSSSEWMVGGNVS